MTRAVPLLVVGAAAVGAGIYFLGASGRDERAIIRSYATAMAHDDYRAMWAAAHAGVAPSDQRAPSSPRS